MGHLGPGITYSVHTTGSHRWSIHTTLCISLSNRIVICNLASHVRLLVACMIARMMDILIVRALLRTHPYANLSPLESYMIKLHFYYPVHN